METYVTQLQLGLVADGDGLVPASLLVLSIHRERLAVIPLKDFKPEIQPRFLGPLPEAVLRFTGLIR